MILNHEIGCILFFGIFARNVQNYLCKSLVVWIFVCHRKLLPFLYYWLFLNVYFSILVTKSMIVLSKLVLKNTRNRIQGFVFKFRRFKPFVVVLFLF